MAARQRTNFSGKVRTQAWARSRGFCEGALPNGERCACELREGFYVFDHILPDALGGRATLDNCQVLCRDCDRPKTAADQGVIADARRLFRAHKGLRAPRKPMAGSRFSPVRRGMNGRRYDRATGKLLSRPGSIDVRDL